MTEEIELATPVTQELAARGPLAAIQKILLAALLEIPEADTALAAEFWRGADILGRDLAAIKREASNRLVAIAPIDEYKYKDEKRTRPQKQQVIPNVGVVEISNDASRTWIDKRYLALEMLSVWVSEHASEHEGELPTPRQTLEWVFDIFQVGDPRTTVMKERGLGSFDDPDNGYVSKGYTRNARVL